MHSSLVLLGDRTMKNIKSLIRNIEWNKPQEIIEVSMKELLKISDEEAILLAEQSNEVCSKPCWYNAALILKAIGYPRNRLTLQYLMYWFQDVNWTGVPIIVELLKEIDTEILIPYIKYAMEKALVDNDDFWAFGLIYLLKELKISQCDFEEDNLFIELFELSQLE